jgi:hypothetical protein
LPAEEPNYCDTDANYCIWDSGYTSRYKGEPGYLGQPCELLGECADSGLLIDPSDNPGPVAPQPDDNIGGLPDVDEENYLSKEFRGRARLCEYNEAAGFGGGECSGGLIIDNGQETTICWNYGGPCGNYANRLAECSMFPCGREANNPFGGLCDTSFATYNWDC